MSKDADESEFPCPCGKGTVVATGKHGLSEINCPECAANRRPEYLILDKPLAFYGDDEEDYRYGVPDRPLSDPFLAALLGREFAPRYDEDEEIVVRSDDPNAAAIQERWEQARDELLRKALEDGEASGDAKDSSFDKIRAKLRERKKPPVE